MMGHYLLNFVAATLAVVAFLYLVFLYIKKNPQIASGVSRNNAPQSRDGKLWVESTLDLEPRKRLYVIRHGQQRVLVATTMDKTEFLTTLEAAPLPEEGQAPDSAPMAAISGTASPLSPNAGWKERLGYSVQQVLSERFSSFGGKTPR